MGTTYQFADEADVLDRMARVMRDAHPRLREAGVKVVVLFAFNPDGDAIKHAGYPALAKVKPLSLKDRVTKEADAELLIDEREWRTLREEQKDALLDHELSHLDRIDLKGDELRKARQEDAKAPVWKLDDLGRPRLRSVPGDWSAGDGFKAVIFRHRAAAIEFHNLARAKAIADAARRAGDRAHGEG